MLEPSPSPTAAARAPPIPSTRHPPPLAQDHPQDLSRGLLRWSWQQQIQVAILPQPCYPPGAKGRLGILRSHPLPQRPCPVLVRDHSTLPRAGERRRDKACTSLSHGCREGNPDHAGGTGPGACWSRGCRRPKHSETITTISASSQPRRKADSEPGPSLDLFYSTVMSNTIFIPISQMGKLRLRKVTNWGQAACKSQS